MSDLLLAYLSYAVARGRPLCSYRVGLPREAWLARGIDLPLRYKSKAVDLVWPRRGCKVKLRAGRDCVSGRGGGSVFLEAQSVPPTLIVSTLP